MKYNLLKIRNYNYLPPRHFVPPLLPRGGESVLYLILAHLSFFVCTFPLLRGYLYIFPTFHLRSMERNEDRTNTEPGTKEVGSRKGVASIKNRISLIMKGMQEENGHKNVKNKIISGLRL